MTSAGADGAAVTPEYLASVKAKQQATWASGDYAVLGAMIQIVGELLAEAVDLRAGERVLDVAAGNGNATLAAARRFGIVTSTDYVPALLERGRRRAEAEGFAITFERADVEALPYQADMFDVVVSTFGAMFAPDQEKAASEMMRVCRPGGRIGLACWTPGGFVGKLFGILATYAPPPPGIRSPLLWGTEAGVHQLFSKASAITSTARDFMFRYRSPEHWVEVFRTYFGPIHKAFASLDAAHQAALESDVIRLLRETDRGGGSGLLVAGEYLEIVITK